MAKTTTIPFTQAIQNPSAVIVNATGFSATNPGTAPTNTVLFAPPASVRATTAGTEGGILKSMIISSDDTSARTVQIWISTDAGTTKNLLGTVVVAALSGTATLVNIDVLANAILTGLPFDETGRTIIMLAASANIYVCVITAAVTASKTIWVTGAVEDF